MHTVKRQLVVLACILFLFPAIAHSQYDLVSPPDGADISSPPTFEWTEGDYDYFVFYAIFNYTGYGYISSPIGWYPIVSLPVTQGWWDAISVDVPNYWFVLGLNTTTYAWEFTGYRAFTKVEPDMARIPSGCFDMGDSIDGCGYTDECPVHNVCISAFEMDVNEVTNADYAECVTDGGCTAPQLSRSSTRLYYYGEPEYDDYPALYVDWSQAADYCTWAGKRLPKEAEWEYAARGGLAGARYPWGNTISGSDANYLGSGDPEDDDTNAVGSYPANGYGLYDMAGNVYEWVSDWYGNLYYLSSPTNDPGGPATGDSRVQRGGSWGHSSSNQRVANRHYRLPGSAANDIGFRCAR